MIQVVLLGFILKKAVLISKTLLKHFLRSVIVICVNSLPSVMIYGFVNILVARFCCHLSWKITRNSWKSLRKVLEYFLQISLATLMHCVKIVRIRSYSGLHFRTEYGQIPENNSEYEHFLRSAVFYRIENGTICMEFFLEEKNKKWKHLLDQYHF